MAASVQNDIRLPGTPPKWVNRTLSVLFGIPGVRSVLGRSFGLITVTGWRTGRRYTTPIQHLAYDGDFIILSQRRRMWWRNLRHEPSVRLQIGRKKMDAHARVVDGAAARPIVADLLRENPRVASFYGIDAGADGDVDPAAIDSLLEHMVVLRVRPDW